MLLLFSSEIDAKSGCCSYHGGVDCDECIDTDGSCICKDGWQDSSYSYSDSCPLKSKFESSNNETNKSMAVNKNIGNNYQYLWLLVPLVIYLGFQYMNENKKTISTEKEQKNKNSNVPLCPKCGSKMVLRYGKRGKFYGCSNYPRCKGTKKYGNYLK